jgi:hypothetical protein
MKKTLAEQLADNLIENAKRKASSPRTPGDFLEGQAVLAGVELEHGKFANDLQSTLQVIRADLAIPVMKLRNLTSGAGVDINKHVLEGRMALRAKYHQD